MIIKFRHIVLLMTTVLLVSSCSSEGDATSDDGGIVPEPVKGTPIVFTAQQGEEAAVTRAATALEENGITAFTVYGYKNTGSAEAPYSAYQTVFPGYTVKWRANTSATSTTNTDGWEYVNQQALGEEEQTIKYWDWQAEAYRFFAVAGATGTNTVEGAFEADGAYYKLTYTADAEHEEDTPYYSHLWFSTGKLPDYSDRQFGESVQLQFIKPLSKVRIIFTFEQYLDPDEDYYTYATTIELTDINFSPTDGNTIKLKGDVTVRYPLTGTADAKEVFAAAPEAEGITAFTRDFTTPITIAGVEYDKPYKNATDAKQYTVLPVTDQGTYTLTVNVDGEPQSTVVPAEYMNWKPGYLYTYIFKVHEDKGISISSVQSAFTQWVNHADSHTVYNW